MRRRALLRVLLVSTPEIRSAARSVYEHNVAEGRMRYIRQICLSHEFGVPDPWAHSTIRDEWRTAWRLHRSGLSLKRDCNVPGMGHMAHACWFARIGGDPLECGA